jgi:hypothetical protein
MEIVRLCHKCLARLLRESFTELTFIIHAHDPASSATLEASSILALPMVGDVNLFLKGESTDEDFEIEVEIMIAGEYALLYTHQAAPYFSAFTPRTILSSERLCERGTATVAVIHYIPAERCSPGNKRCMHSASTASPATRQAFRAHRDLE